jgi:hypothetical protein
VPTRTPELHSILARKHHGLGRAEGRAEGERELLLMYLGDRGWVLSVRQRDRINSCDDPDMIKGWFVRAMKAESVDEIFD